MYLWCIVLILTYVLCTITLAFLLHLILNYIPMQLILQLIVHGFMFELLVTSENGDVYRASCGDFHTHSYITC